MGSSRSPAKPLRGLSQERRLPFAIVSGGKEGRLGRLRFSRRQARRRRKWRRLLLTLHEGFTRSGIRSLSADKPRIDRFHALSASGSVIVNVVPKPGWLSTVIVP